MQESPLLGANGYLKPEYARQVAVKDFHCPRCDASVGLEDGWLLVTNRRIVCNCGKAYDIFDVTVRLSAGNPSSRYLHEAAVREASWYHATIQPNWERLMKRKNPITVHLGTENAAFDRAIGRYLSRYRPFADQSFMLYEVKLKSGVNIAPRITEDENSDRPRIPGSDVTRYVNRWEDPASISLAVRSTAIELVGKREVSAEEAFSRLCFNNMKP